MRMIRIIIGFFVLVSGASVQADEIMYKELVLKCRSCRQHTSKLCEMEVNGAPLVLSCREAAQRLLRAFVHTRDESYLPDARQIRNYLLRDTVDEASARDSLALLIRTARGQSVLTDSLAAVLKYYQPSFVHAVLNAPEGIDAFARMLKEPVLKRPQYASARSALAFKSGTDALDYLVRSLPVLDVTRAISELQSFSLTLKAVSPPRAAQFNEAASYLEACMQTTNACALLPVPTLTPTLGRYLRDVRYTKVLQAMDQNDLSSEKKLRLLSASDFRDRLTPRTINLVADIILEAKQSKNEALLDLLANGSGFSLAEAVAERHEEAHHALREILTSHQYLPNGTRQDEIPDQFETLEFTSSVSREELADYRLHGSNTLLIICCVLLFCALLGTILLLRGWNATRAFLDGGDNKETEKYIANYVEKNIAKQQERLELSRVFSLGTPPAREQLRKSYREQLREVHPDSGGSIDEFYLLQQRYERAREVFFGEA